MQEKDKRIIRNTIIQYVKILISAIVSLISTRIVLQQLGIDDYGIFSVVAGMIALFSILNGAMTVAVQRYLSYEIPLGDDAKINSIYNNSRMTLGKAGICKLGECIHAYRRNDLNNIAIPLRRCYWQGYVACG